MYKPIHFLIRNPSTTVYGFQSLTVAFGSLQNRKFSTERFFIRNQELPVCSNCLHFIGYTKNNPFDSYRCKKFGEMDLITGAIKYDLAAVCRLDDDMCGEEGDEYTAKNQTPSTMSMEFSRLPTPSGSGSIQS